jgi:hypothetical protein
MLSLPIKLEPSILSTLRLVKSLNEAIPSHGTVQENTLDWKVGRQSIRVAWERWCKQLSEDGGFSGTAQNRERLAIG